MCRSNLRPLVLPATYVATRDAPPPPQTPAKQAYDLVGTVCTLLLLNYMAAPFMLLSIQDSVTGWSRLGHYGLIMIVVAFALSDSVVRDIEVNTVRCPCALSLD